MSEDAGADKPHEASARKIEEARKKGDTPSSRELVTFASLAAIAAAVPVLGPGAARSLGSSLAPLWDRADAVPIGTGADAVALMGHLGGAALAALLPVMALLAAAGVAAGAAQGARPAAKRVTPDPSRLSPAKGLKRLFGPQGLMEFAKAVLKIGVFGAILAAATWPGVPPLVALVSAPPDAGTGALLRLLGRMTALLAALAGVLAIADVAWTRHSWRRKLRMSDEEMRQEMKGAEGDPIVKSRRMSLRRERARHSMMNAVDSAAFVVANPTHVAVALRYDRARDPAPVVVAKGRDHVALRIRARAEAAGVKVIEDRPLARALEAQVALDQTIPEELFAAVATIVRHLDAVRARH